MLSGCHCPAAGGLQAQWDGAGSLRGLSFSQVEYDAASVGGVQGLRPWDFTAELFQLFPLCACLWLEAGLKVGGWSCTVELVLLLPSVCSDMARCTSNDCFCPDHSVAVARVSSVPSKYVYYLLLAVSAAALQGNSVGAGGPGAGAQCGLWGHPNKLTGTPGRFQAAASVLGLGEM